MTKQELDKRINDTYYSEKNKEILPSFVVISLFFLICSNRLLLELGLWIIYAAICANNNEKLRNCPTAIRERNYLIENYDRLLDKE